jgi:hypothetical protein
MTKLSLCLIWLIVIAANGNAKDNTPTVNAAMTVFGYIIGHDATIERCRQVDTHDAPSYDRVYAKYHEDVEDTIIKIRFLLDEEARRSGVSKDFFPSNFEKLTEMARQETQRMAASNPGTFMEICRILPRAVVAGTAPFQPLREKYADEMRLIDGWQ